MGIQRMNLFLNFFLAFFSEFFALRLEVDADIFVEMATLNNYTYIQKEIGQNVSLRCVGVLVNSWEFPVKANSPLDGYSLPDFRKRTEIRLDELGSTLHIRNLKSTDTGEYACESGLETKQIYIFVKSKQRFLKRKDEVLPITLSEPCSNIVIPCRTTAKTKQGTMRLFVADNEWANFCWQFLNVSKEFIIVGSKEEFSDANVTCIPISTCYDARFGFVFPLERQFFPSTKLLWSQFNKKRFRCEHQNESFEVLTQAVAVIGSDKYKEQSRQVNCSVSEKNLTFHASPLSLTLSCLNCNTTIDALAVDQIIERLHKRKTLAMMEDFWKAAITRKVEFCQWIQNINDDILLAKNSQQQEFSFHVIIILVFVLLVLLLLICVCYVFLFNNIKKRTKKSVLEMIMISNEEDLISLQVPDPSALRLIAKGAYGEVFELVGHQPPTVIKFLYSDIQKRDDFQREFEILKKLKHPNVVQLVSLEILDENERVGIIMEYCQRGDLRQVLFNPSIIYTINTVVVWGKQLFDALEYMFETHRVIHRDIKPENIFVTQEFSLKIGDFGLVKHSEKTGTGTYVGTQRYIPPDVQTASNLWKVEVSHRNDVYALGLNIWQMIERRNVFEEYSSHGYFNRDSFIHDIMYGIITHVQPPDCQKCLQQVIQRCTNFNRNMRPMALEMLNELKLIDQKDPFIARLKFLPIVNESQTKILRPIGFDGTKNRIPVLEQKDAFFDLSPPMRCMSLSSTATGKSVRSFEKLESLEPEEEITVFDRSESRA